MNIKSVRLSQIGALLLVLLATGACQTSSPDARPAAATLPKSAAAPATLRYPATRTVSQTDNYHGTQVADPYRWLEDDVRENPAVRSWADAQQQLTRSYLDTLPDRAQFAQSLEKLWDYERSSVPEKAGERYFFSYNDGLMNQNQVRVRERLDGPARVLLDPNQWAEDGTTALAGFVPSPNGRYLAYLVQEDGSDWRRAKVLDVGSGEVLTDDLQWLKFTSLSWRADSSGFYYSRYPKPEAGAAFQSLNKHHTVYWHALGTEQTKDFRVVYNEAEPELSHFATVSHDGTWLVVRARKGTDARNQLIIKDLRSDASPRHLIQGFENEYTFIAHVNDELYFITDLRAPRKRVIAINPSTGAQREVVPQADTPLQTASAVGDRLLLSYLKDASSALRLVDFNGQAKGEVALPAIGSVGGFSGKPGEPEAFLSFSSFTYPRQVLQLNLQTAQTKTLIKSKVEIDPAMFEISQRFAESADGTRVPYFVVHRKGLTLDGSNPTILYGYGGFSISLTPQYSTPRIAWLQAGGVYVVANLRGGGEYGLQWHKAGTVLNKQNVFDDCIAVAESLIDAGYTSAEHLSLMGGSNGGLLVGAVINQRPDLFRAAVPVVGVMDMLRFHHFTAGRFWTDDYGSADDPEQFKALYAYSPYHNIKLGQRYPATMVVTADTDDRVVPGHSFKYAAQLQAAADPGAPALLYVESNAGHGAGTPTEKLIRRYADLWAFLWDQLKG